LLSIFYGLLAALGWGAADFSGGLASRKASAYQAVLYAEFIGIPIILIALLFVDEALPPLRSWIFAMSAGAIGTLGLTLLYRAMAEGVMSIAAPVSALLAAVFPVVVGMFIEGLPGWATVLGFVFALFAVWMVSQGEGGVTDILAHLSDLKLPLIAGMCFGSYFILMHDATSDGTAFYPMLASRTGGTIFIIAYMFISRSPWKVQNKSAWWLIALNGTMDIGGNLFFILSGQTGRLDVASVLSSLFSGVTVILAWIILKERLSATQWIGVASAFVAIVLMTI
jgi:drug/metabolite transporter (DMT)-like permease